MAADPAIRVLIADDQRLFAEALAGTLAHDPQIDVVGIAANGAEAVSLSGVLQPDVILMDLRMPVMDGVAAIKAIVDGDGAPQILVRTGSDDQEALQAARRAGAAGYLTKDRSSLELRERSQASCRSRPPSAREHRWGRSARRIRPPPSLAV